MTIQLRKKTQPNRNEPCSCGSGLKFKKCHGDLLKLQICNRCANEKMVELIREEQKKQIIRMQQENCKECGGTGIKDNIKCICQFANQDDYSKYYYERAKNNE